MSIVHSTRITSGFITKSNIANVTRSRLASYQSEIALLFNGNVNTTTFVDSSPKVRVITTNGNSITSNTQTKFGNVLYVDGSGDYLTWPANADFELAGGDHTTETWFYRTAATTTCLWSISNATGSGGYAGNQFNIRDDGSAIWLCGSSASAWINTSNVAVAGTFQNNVWTHVACVRSGSDFSVYKNGRRVGGYTSATPIGTINGVNYLAARRNGATIGELPLTGYMTNFRLVKAPIYRANFEPNTDALTSTGIIPIINSATSLNFNDTVGTTTFTDGSYLARTITTAGNSTTSNTQTKFGNVLYIDGTGDYLSWPYNAISDTYGSANHTTECWIYVPTLSGDSELWSLNAGATGAGYASNRLAFRPDYSIVWLTAATSSTWISTANVAPAGSLTVNTWAHIAAVKNGNDFSVYVNGTRTGGFTSATAIHNFSGTNYLGCSLNAGVPTRFWNGYITNFRFTPAAIYTGSFTVSESALSANNIPIAGSVTNNTYGLRKNY